ncbi:gas vesicle protein [Candidatus Chloroploca sp. M-50]|uniref:Gas vesicle protein n=1 Tax=Candidatus Chloroploca mongolica TaxID=2528176 RepID=A0ABS4DC77_9CHLR|nr:gas vesicle protein [Candidatus Chloroploca mongolica]MBP1467052.1 gas vesicle protein [Candidatus Chloroploca mongolica]
MGDDFEGREIAIIDLLDRALDKGVFLWGELTLSIADVDLVYVGLKALICSVDTADKMRNAAWYQLVERQRELEV